MLYHFISSQFKDSVDPQDLFNKVLDDGALISSADRENKPGGMWLKRDPKEDKQYIFLTTQRDFMSRARKCLTNYMIRKGREPNFDIYGFAIDSNKLRYKPGVLFRDGDSQFASTQPFTDQVLTDHCEVLVPNKLDIKEYAIKLIEKDEEYSLTGKLKTMEKDNVW